MAAPKETFNPIKNKPRLHPEEMDTIASGTAPNFYLIVTVPQAAGEALVYVDTIEQGLMYGPITTAVTNLSIVTVLTLESPNVYVISNVVLPENMLMATTILPNPSTPDTVYKANIDYLPGPAVKFTRLWDDDIKKYAFYTLIDNDPAKRAYLLPYPDDTQTGHRKNTIRAVQTVDQSATGKYVFEVTDTDYSN